MTCRNCIFYDHCILRLSYSMGDDETTGKELTNMEECCRSFKDKADFVEVVRCKDCANSYFVGSCSKYECRMGCGRLKYSNDFCSYGQKKFVTNVNICRIEKSK